MTSFTLLLTYTPLNPPIKNLFVCFYIFLRSSLRICSFYENLFESFLSLRISSYLWSSVRIYFRNSLVKQASVWIPSFKANLLSSKHDNDIFLISHIPILWFLLSNLFIWCLIISLHLFFSIVKINIFFRIV